MRDVTSRLYVVSVFQTNRTFIENYDAHKDAIDFLVERDLAPAEAIGQYKGAEEYSIVLQGDINIEKIVANLANEYNQESYLVVYSEGTAELVYPQPNQHGRVVRKTIGMWKNVGSEKPIGDYTKIGNTYFTVEGK